MRNLYKYLMDEASYFVMQEAMISSVTPFLDFVYG